MIKIPIKINTPPIHITQPPAQTATQSSHTSGTSAGSANSGSSQSSSSSSGSHNSSSSSGSHNSSSSSGSHNSSSSSGSHNSSSSSGSTGSTGSSGSSGNTGTGSASGSTSSSSAGSTGGNGRIPIPSFESLLQEMLNYYMPETVTFTPLSEEVLADTIRNWLRPAYEQAIQNRRDWTERINAELDADAWSRGMGQSTYLSDLKERQYESEMQDVDALESDYAASLAQHLLDALQEQQEAQQEIEQFNAEQMSQAQEQAAATAQTLYLTYLNNAIQMEHEAAAAAAAAAAGTEPTPEPASTSNAAPAVNEEPTGSTFAGSLMSAQPQSNPVDYRTIANLVSRMSGEERRKLYNRYNAAYAKLRYDILNSIGEAGFAALMQEFPAS